MRASLVHAMPGAGSPAPARVAASEARFGAGAGRVRPEPGGRGLPGYGAVIATVPEVALRTPSPLIAHTWAYSLFVRKMSAIALT